jgi:hypothetical protein
MKFSQAYQTLSHILTVKFTQDNEEKKFRAQNPAISLPLTFFLHTYTQFAGGRLLACIASRPGQCGQADGYVQQFTCVFLLQRA